MKIVLAKSKRTKATLTLLGFAFLAAVGCSTSSTLRENGLSEGCAVPRGRCAVVIADPPFTRYALIFEY